MRRYHHIGIPTTEAKPGETHLKHLKLFVVSHEKSEFGVEWMRFEADAAVPDLVRQVPHVAFEVADLASELAGREILIPPNSPSDGVRVAFIVENGAPIELLEFTDPNHPGPPSAEQDADISTLHPKQLLERSESHFDVLRNTQSSLGVPAMLRETQPHCADGAARQVKFILRPFFL
jgi:hypothetical protein